MAVSIYDVAKRAGVSISTVSRIINNSAAVNEKKVAAVKEAMEYYNYEPNQFGRGLVMQKSNLIGIYFETFNNNIFQSTYNLELLRGIEEMLSHHNYSMVLLSESNQQRYRLNAKPKYMEFIQQKKIDGLLLSSLSDKAIKDQVFEQIVKENFPMVYIGKRIHQKGLNAYAQYEQYTIRMLDVLRQHGHRKILFHTGSMHQHYLDNILRQVEKQMPELEIHSIVLQELIYEREQVLKIFQKHVIEQKCTAVCLPAMELVPVALSVCAQLQIHVPEQLSLISVEHKLGEGEFFFPAISSFYVPAREIGSGAAELLLKEVEGQELEGQSIEYDTQYIERESIRRI